MQTPAAASGATTTTTKRRREKTTHPTVSGRVHQYQFNEDIDLTVAVSSDEDEENDQERNRNKCRRKKKKEENELNQLEVGEKDHLFFQLDPRTKPTDVAHESTTAQLDSSLVCYGHPSIIYPPPTSSLSVSPSDESHHLLPLVMRHQTNLSELELSSPDPSATTDMTIYIDRYDLRLLLDQSEWLSFARTSLDDMSDESKEDVVAKPMSADDTDLVHACSTETTEDETRAPIYLSGGAPPLELIRERVTELEWYQLQQERFQDLSQHKSTVVEADSQQTTVALVLEATTPMMDLDEETLDDELNKRQLMASRGQAFHYSYQSSESEGVGSSTASSSSSSSSIAAVDRVEVNQTDGASTSATIDDKKVETPTMEQEFQPPFTVPDGIRLPFTLKEHRIIAQTVKFLLTQGGQEEFKLKLKQNDNPSFYFLNYDHPLHPYYQWLKQHPKCADVEVVEKKKINVTVAPVLAKSSSPFSTTPTPTVIAVSPSTSTASGAVTVATEVLSVIKAPPGVKPPPGIRKLPQIPIVLTTATKAPSTTSGAVGPQTTPTEIVGQLVLGYSDDEEEDEKKEKKEDKSVGETIHIDPQLPTDPAISTEAKDSTPMIDSSSDVNNQEDSELMEQTPPLDQSPAHVSTTTLVSRSPSSNASPATFVPVNKPPSLVGLLGYYDDDDDEESMESSSHLPSTTNHSLAPASTATSTEIPPLGRIAPSTHPNDVTATPCAPTHESTSTSAPPAATTADLQSLPLPPSTFARIPIPSALLALLPTPPQPIPSDQILTVIHKLCHFIHKNGPAFEALTRTRERTNPTFQFLHEGSPYFPYYQWVQSVQPILEVEESTNKVSAAVTPPKPTPAGAPFDPASIHPVTAPPSPFVSTTNTTMDATATTPVTTATSSMAEMLEAAKQQLREKLKLINYKLEEE